MKDNSISPRFVVAALILAGTLMRIYGAWVYAEAHTSDHGIVCLMVKHIIEGRELPVFFYGLPYMGAIEPYTSVILCRIFGLTGFMINMGTALMGILLLPAIYMWGRAAGGKLTGIAALAFCVVGPEFYFQFQSWANGGYAAILLVNVLLLWLGIRMLNSAQAADGRLSLAAHLLLGFMVGVAWFLSPLTISAIATLGIIYLTVLKFRIFSWKLLASGLAFMVGSIPLWIWNLSNDWQTFDMLGGKGAPGLRKGLQLFYVDRLFTLLDLGKGKPVLDWAILSIYMAAAVFCISFLVKKALLRRLRANHLHLLAATLYIVVSSLLFTRSHLALAPAVRYLLPIIPAIAIILGFFTASLSRRVRWFAWIPLSLILMYQCSQLPQLHAARLAYESFERKAQIFGEMLEALGVEHVYTKYQVHWANHGLNFVLDERFVFSGLNRERYRPYAKSIEAASDVAVLNDLAGFSSFLEATEGYAILDGLEGFALHYGIRPSTRPSVELGPDKVTSLRCDAGIDHLKTLTDADSFSAVDIAREGVSQSALTIKLQSPEGVSGVRLAMPTKDLPRSISVHARENPDDDWQIIKDVPNLTGYFWSGERFYWGEESYRFEMNFEAANASELRLLFTMRQNQTSAKLSEIQLFVTSDRKRLQSATISDLLQELNKRNIESVYADRWLSNQLREKSHGAVNVFNDKKYWPSLPQRVSLTPATAFVLDVKERELMLRVLAESQIEMQIDTLGNWDLYTFTAEDWRPELIRYPGLIWKGYAPLMLRDKMLAQYYYDRAVELSGTGDDEHTLARLKRALEAYPNHKPAMLLQHELMEISGDKSGAVRVLEKYHASRISAIPAEVRFRNGIRFLGFTIDTDGLRIGQAFEVAYFWKVPENVDPHQLAVFVHFKRGREILFQGDHVLLVGRQTEYQPFDEVFVERRQVLVPADIAPGQISIEMGLYERTGRNMRIRFRSDLEGKGWRSFRLPVELKIEEGS